MFNPGATYRLQLHKDFNFAHLEQIIPCLQQLGVSTVYASPILEAVPGSMHGYDGINPNRINPEIGTLEQFREISKKLKEVGISWLQDIVPNHMAFHPGNCWLMDVLEKGAHSEYAGFFDIKWNEDKATTRLMVPFLGNELSKVIEDKELQIACIEGKFFFKYYDNTFPLGQQSYATIINTNNQSQDIKDQLSVLLKENIVGAFAEKLKAGNPEITTFINTCLQIINNQPSHLQAIADEQHYRLCHWQETNKQINYRRFFTINGLICLNIQNKKVFDHYHTFIKSLIDEDLIQGLRVDHIDGLFDPTEYLHRLKELAGDNIYITVEKILESGEELPLQWPVQGTTGYDFLGTVNNLFTKENNKNKFTTFYNKLVKNKESIHRQLHDKKAQILYSHMNGELENLYCLFKDLKLADEDVLSTIPPDNLKKTIGEFLIDCPVYRYYGNKFPLRGEEADAIHATLNRIKDKDGWLESAVDALKEALLHTKEESKENALLFYQRCMQFTGPLMAKGVEDTLMYTYNNFIGHNEVGDSPESFGISVHDFHKVMQQRQQNWPMAMNATATHDTKRGEDVRARLNAFTDLGEEWLETVVRWKQINRDIKQNGIPDVNDEYFIYQALAGSHPMPDEDNDNFTERFQAYMQKVLREAKTHSDWAKPDEPYEQGTNAFIASILDKDNAFLKDFLAFHEKMVDKGIINSLAQLLIKFTTPGIPDVYQGCELWDLSMVDPDNRRPVDYDKRAQWLKELPDKNSEELIKSLWDERYNGKIKLWLTHTLLKERTKEKDFFTKAHYQPLKATGKHKDNIIAFIRAYEDNWYIVVAPLHIAADMDWEDTSISLPDNAPMQWCNLLSGNLFEKKDSIAVSDIFKELPLALLKGKRQAGSRSAGILLPVFSLQSPFGIGDFGPGARKFADFLHQGGQKLWQMLPLNPTELKNAHSPYSSISSMANNPLLISLELLAEEGLLNTDRLKESYLPQKNKVDYEAAENLKLKLYDEAYSNFVNEDFISLKYRFATFCKREAYWLNDFALYVTLKRRFDDAPWHDWPEEYKKRSAEALQVITKEGSDELHKVKWLQFIADVQWKQLKVYCNHLSIKIFGDMPFYVNYDSADVWANPSIFCLDHDGVMTGIAGVPPDYFSETGQLWGMPTYNWGQLRATQYKWWINRLKKNLEQFDIIRLDHFRAFAEYWQVPAGQENAINGEWLQGPGADFFKVAEQELGSLPIVAEDLGDNMEKVYQLRDALKLPGMKVLQFAWGDNMPVSVDIPHNYPVNCVAYTGTHDNNTTAGWYKEETKKADHKRMAEYLGLQVGRKSINDVLIRVIYASVAKMAIVPMQDILGLDETSRMNLPGTSTDNWLWRLSDKDLTSKTARELKRWVVLYNRK